jgi:outer membrane protein OmpA-like peptidoglycan-associated protein
MWFETEFEMEQELELEFPPPLKTRQLIESKSSAGGFMARISGFDENITTSRDPAVVRMHNAAVNSIVREIATRTRAGWCVEVMVQGHADPQNDSKPPDSISLARARAIASKIASRIPSTVSGVRGISPSGAGARDPLWPSSTHIQRALNRRVEVTIMQILCA